MKTNIKLYPFLVLGLFIPLGSVAQTNTFPTSGSVGIGTTSPLAKLSVHSTGTIGLSGTYANSSIYITDGTQQLGIDPNQIYAAQELTLTAATGYLGFITSGVERIRVLNNGRVGIGNLATDLSGTALDQLVVGNGTSSQGIVVYHGSSHDAGYAFANSTGSVTSRILYSSSVDQLRLQYGGGDRLTIGNNKIKLLKNTEVNGRLFFGDFGNEGVGTIQIKNEGPNDGIALWTETGNITKRIWIDDATNTLQLTAGANLSKGLSVDEDGNVGIGTSNPTKELEVNGTIRSKEVIVEATNWPDYVFEEDYDLPTLSEIEAFIKANKHLPEVPSAKEMEANGISLGEMNMLLLKKIEELTLHTIEQELALEIKQQMIDQLEVGISTEISIREEQQQKLKTLEALVNQLIIKVELLEPKK